MELNEEPPSDDWPEFWLDVASGEDSRICSAMAFASLHALDTAPVEAAALSMLTSASYQIREIALCALGHLAYPRKRIIHLQAVLEAVERFEQFPEHQGRLKDVHDDLRAGGFIPKPPDPYAEMEVSDSEGNLYRKGDDGFWTSQAPVRTDSAGHRVWRYYHREGTVLTLVDEWTGADELPTDHAGGTQGDRQIPLPAPDPNFYAPLPSPGAHRDEMGP